MKLLIASDIHGSAFYCKRLIEAFKNEHADKILLLGDILYHGPRNDLPEGYAPKEVISMLNNIKEYIICVRGNCDTEVDQMVLEFPVLSEQAYLCLDDVEMLAVHGHKPFPPVKCKTIVLSGHTHVPKLEEANGVAYMNPGSVSIPKENSHHGYMVFENKKFIWKDFDGNVKNEYSVK
ncbi:MAG: phosphodiesterase [Oscillospiraceae bacterium]|nr:phosphodiesterase [Oscillospiraceae bacterium]MBP1575322.1 phosphodiesterase [Oscillospiraceae bacterium]MBQ8595792.1 phosphodiesterase [Oscillospiraceae bacterium]